MCSPDWSSPAMSSCSMPAVGRGALPRRLIDRLPHGVSSRWTSRRRWWTPRGERLGPRWMCASWICSSSSWSSRSTRSSRPPPSTGSPTTTALPTPARGPAPRRSTGRAMWGIGQHLRSCAARSPRRSSREPYAEPLPPSGEPTVELRDGGATRERLLAAGFAAAECWLRRRRASPSIRGSSSPRSCSGPHVQRLPEELREPFMDDVLRTMREPVVVDYVRLNIDAVA